MRTIALACIPIAICCAAEPAVEKAAEPAVRIYPEMVSLNINQYFDESGKPRNASADLRVELALKPNGGRQLLACRGVQVSTAITDAGEVLKPRQRGMEMGVETFSQHERERDDYDVSVMFAAPASPQGIAKLAGSITLAVAAGEPTQSELKPLKDYLGKALLLEGMDQPITITRENGRITVRSSREAFERIDAVKGARADGRAIDFNGWGGGSNGDDYYRNYSADVPDDGAVTIRLLPAASEITVPFSLGPIPLLAAPAAVPAQAVRVPASKPKPAPEPNKPRVAPEPPAGGNGF